ncbi:DUF2240 family protein [Candidatus Woesearchaeota archaeon]|nr:MAG: DUF2240 family protein [Candidatus Woesearchaeota archaeon]
MIEVPYETILQKIQEQQGISREELEERIKEKLDQLSGLISKEGAAHIIANELGVKVIEVPPRGKLSIKDLLPGMRAVELLGKVSRVFEQRTFNKDGKEGKVANFILNDGTGTTRVVLWNKQADHLNQLHEGTVVLIKGATVRDNNGRAEVHLSDSSTLTINPLNVNPDDIIQKPKRKHLGELTPGEEQVEVLGTIVQVFSPRFFDKCPQCGKRVRADAKGAVCDVHGPITPNTSYVLNLYLDDGTANMQVVLWQNQVQKLLGKTHEEILAYKEAPHEFEAVKTDLLGTIIKLVGKAQHNTMFDRTEFVANLVFPNVSPKEELALIEAEQERSASNEAGPQEKPSGLDQEAANEAEVENPENIEAEQINTAKDTSADAPSPTTQQEEDEEAFEEDLLSLEDLEDLD